MNVKYVIIQLVHASTVCSSTGRALVMLEARKFLLANTNSIFSACFTFLPEKGYHYRRLPSGLLSIDSNDV